MIDLHVHSNRSDGTYSPRELVDYAIEKGLAAMALTDHDTVDGLQEALKYAKALADAPEIIPGIEFSTEYQGRDIHIVGLYIDYENEEFRSYLQEFVDSRNTRNEKMCAKLREHGVDITYEALLAEFPNAVITRAHYAKYLLNHGYIKNMEQAFSKYVGDNAPCYIPREKVTPTQAVQLILQASGVPILAHPTLYHMSDRRLDALVAELKDAGLVGIETIYSTYTPAEARQMKALAEKYQLLSSGGSDFHGGNKPGLDLGVGYGKLNVPDSVLEDIKTYMTTVKKKPKETCSCMVTEKKITDSLSSKILFSDMDGTLLLSNSTVSPAMKEGIRKMTSAGHHLVLSSGRPLPSILEVCELCDLKFPNMYIISNNGALVYDFENGRNILEYRIAQSDIETIVKMAGDEGIHIHGYTDTEIVCYHDNAELQFYTRRIHLPLVCVDNIAAALPQGSYKLQMIHLTDRTVLERFRDKLLAREDLKGSIQAFFSNDQYLEILPAAANKGAAIQFVTDYLKVSPENTFGAGDAENDITMLDAAHIGVAMQNASDAVKEHADIITEKTNDEDGLLEVIEKYFL